MFPSTTIYSTCPITSHYINEIHAQSSPQKALEELNMNSNHFNIHRLILSLLAALHHQNTCYVSFVCVLMIMHMHTYKPYSLKFSRVKFCGFWNSTYVTLIILSSSIIQSKFMKILFSKWHNSLFHKNFMSFENFMLYGTYTRIYS